MKGCIVNILALDPGDKRTAFVHFDPVSEMILDKAICDNELTIQEIKKFRDSIFVIEMIASYGMAVGANVFETCVWIGKFIREAELCGMRIERIYRREEKLLLCGNSRAKDTNIRQYLIDRYGPPGTMKNPGRTYGISKDLWSALAVAVTYAIKNQLCKLPF
jgi:hypothetical protein